MEWLILLIIVSVIFALYKPKIKGYMGESAVANRLFGLPENEYKVLNNIMIKTDYGTTQIDHIVVSIYGIFVIETKNYKGWITGGEYSEYWVKNMYGKKYSFMNPLKQNYAHVKALESKLGISKDNFIPIVAFSSDSNIKVNVSTPVIYIAQIRHVIQEYTQVKLSINNLDKIVEQIQNLNITTKDAKKEHISQIRNKTSENKTKINHAICPKCGGVLVERNGKYGKFIGCNNYPKCHFTLKQ